MKHPLIPLIVSAILQFGNSAIASAAVPLRWTVETSRAQPATFEAYQGETLELEARLQSYGKPLEAPSSYALYWQTNGMGSTWWSTNLSNLSNVSNLSNPSNLLRATWRPEYDVGARAYNCFIGQPGTIYHAAFQLRLRPSPGAVPNELPLPVKTIDFSKVVVTNAPWITASTATNIANHIVGVATNYTDATVAGYVPWTKDRDGKLTAVTIGSRAGGSVIGSWSLALGNAMRAGGEYSRAEGFLADASGNYSHAEGYSTQADGEYSHAEGHSTHAVGNFSHAAGYFARTQFGHDRAFAWQGVDTTTFYLSHGAGTFNLNPVGGLSGFWVGETNMAQHIKNLAPHYTPSATDPIFSNAVLAVGLNIDTNAVAVLNEIAATFGDFPVEGTATTVGGLLAALAAAIAWLKKNKANKAELRYAFASSSATVQAQDRTVTKVTLGTTSVTVTFPDATAGKTRDFLLRIDAANLATGGALVITKPTGATIYGDAFPSPEAAKQYLVAITETAANEFYVRTIEITTPTEG